MTKHLWIGSGAPRGKSFRKKVSSASVTPTYPRERRQRGTKSRSQREG